jgi:aminoglycoside phosphotransferase (APT) family kinase protein
MRLGWGRSQPALTPSADDVLAMVRAARPDAEVRRVAPVEGGLANTNLRVELGDGPVLLRLYQHDATQAEKEAALAARLHGGDVPVARFFHVGQHENYRFALVEWVAGQRLETLLPGMADDARARVGENVGRTLAAIHAVRFGQQGFLDAKLEVATPLDGGPEFFVEFLKASFVDGAGRELLGPALADAAMEYARANRDLRWPGPATLVHCDFNGSNILMRGEEVAAVIDWEFAMSARGDMDFGNLERNHPEAAFLDGVVRGYRAAGGELPENWRIIARLTDLMAWADLLQRPNLHPSVAQSARDAIRKTIDEA